jgi:hypothetical protein
VRPDGGLEEAVERRGALVGILPSLVLEAERRSTLVLGKAVGLDRPDPGGAM